MQPQEKKTAPFGLLPHFKITILSPGNPETQNHCNGCEREHFEILWIKEGEGTYRVDKSEFTLTSNSVYYGAPGRHHQIIPSRPLQGFVIAFNEDFLHNGFDVDSGLQTADILNDFLRSAIIKMHEPSGLELHSLIQKMFLESESTKEMKMDILRFYLRILMIHVRRSMDKQVNESGVGNRMVLKFFAQIEKDYYEKKSVSDYANMLCVTPNYLNQMVKQHTGSTAGFYIRRRIIAEAKSKALHSHESMKEIAYSLGFDSEAHFSKFFKNYIGVNFSEYKRASRPSGNSARVINQLQHY